MQHFKIHAARLGASLNQIDRAVKALRVYSPVSGLKDYHDSKSDNLVMAPFEATIAGLLSWGLEREKFS